MSLFAQKILNLVCFCHSSSKTMDKLRWNLSISMKVSSLVWNISIFLSKNDRILNLHLKIPNFHLKIPNFTFRCINVIFSTPRIFSISCYLSRCRVSIFSHTFRASIQIVHFKLTVFLKANWSDCPWLVGRICQISYKFYFSALKLAESHL